MQILLCIFEERCVNDVIFYYSVSVCNVLGNVRCSKSSFVLCSLFYILIRDCLSIKSFIGLKYNCQHISWDVDMAFLMLDHIVSAKECVHENDHNVKLYRCGRLQGCAIECLQKLGPSVPVAYFHPLTRLFKGYMFI